MKIDFEGRMWQFDLDDVSLKQGLAIADHTGLAPLPWFQSLGDSGSVAWLKSMQCLYWVLREQNGETGAALSDDFSPLKLFKAFGDAAGAAASAEAAAEEDPTRPAGELAAEPPPRPGPASLPG